jgi:hypothetical protein
VILLNFSRKIVGYYLKVINDRFLPLPSPSLAKHPFLSHGLPQKTLPDLSELGHPVFTALDFATVMFSEFAFVRYWRKNGSTMRQYISHL